ncbi:MAG: hypothetical protein SVU88_03495 [Candidatus Nanohaloarchaea archaeon]|nr:hypothetical protein [Candidatus Nanohaloarchaea archaeon]
MILECPYCGVTLHDARDANYYAHVRFRRSYEAEKDFVDNVHGESGETKPPEVLAR